MNLMENIAVVEATARALNARDYQEYEALHSDSFLYVGPDHPEGIVGNKAFTDDLKAWVNAFPDLTIESELVFGDGEWLCVAGSVRGTHTGPLPMPDGSAIHPTNRGFALRNCSLFKVVNGKLVEQRHYYDQAAFTLQLGV